MSARDGHLGDLAAALVDGALDGDTRDHALAHVAGCPRCWSDLDEQRQVKDRLRRLAEPDVPHALGRRLADIAAAATLDTAAANPAAGRPGPIPSRRVDRAGRPATGPRGSRPAPRRRRHRRRLAGGVSALAVGVAVVVVALGPGRDQGPAVSPAVVRYSVEHAQSTGGFPGADPAAGAVMTVSTER
ncbi:MAG: zf-HC2 domain-containing protein [Pseudonocardiales bacterium]